MRNKKGFTLIELLAVIVILGLLLAIAIPSITRYITQSRKKTLATTISKYVDASMVSVNNGEYIFNDSNVIYAIPIECVPMERGGDNPFGEWLQVNNEYWAYVLVQYNPSDFSYNYGFTFKDSAGYGMHPVSLEDMDVKGKDIVTNLELAQPRTGLASNFSTVDYWEKSGFNVNSETRVKVLQSRLEGDVGDGENTCTLHNRGLNYKEIEEMKNRPGTLINTSWDTNNVFGKEMQRSMIEEIYTLDYIDVPTDAIDSWDASIQKNESVMAYITDKDKDNLYELYLAQDGGVIAPNNGYQLFLRYSNVTKMKLDKLDTSNVSSMTSMFQGCSLLKSLDLSNFNTSNVTSMSNMFFECSRLEKLNLSSFDTSNVTAMVYMFYGCRSLVSLDLSSFDTKEVTNMAMMFRYNSLLKSLDLSNFDTSKVTNMNTMFHDCSSLINLDVSSFNTSNVVDMYAMFRNCKSLLALDVSNFDTSKVTNMSSMFSNCSSLTNLDLRNFDTSKVTNMSSMFSNCSSLTNLDLRNFDTSNVTAMSSMFRGCSSLTNLDLSSFDTSNMTDMGMMFNNMEKLEKMDIRKFDFSKVTSSMTWCFPGFTLKIIVKDDNTRNWILTNVSSNFTNIVTVNEL